MIALTFLCGEGRRLYFDLAACVWYPWRRPHLHAGWPSLPGPATWHSSAGIL